MERSFKAARESARKEGLLVGISSRVIMYIALKKQKSQQRKIVIAVLSDGREKYLSTKLFEEQ